MDQQIKEKELSISNTEEKYRQLIEQAGDACAHSHRLNRTTR